MPGLFFLHFGDYFGPNGWFELRGYPVRCGSSAKARDTATAAQLWTVSEQLTKTTFPA